MPNAHLATRWICSPAWRARASERRIAAIVPDGVVRWPGHPTWWLRPITFRRMTGRMLWDATGGVE